MSIWLDLMRSRLQIIHSLLSAEGTLFVHIDAAYLPYITIMLDEIFGRINRMYLITFKQGTATGHKAIYPGCVTTTNFILMYAKDKNNWRPNKVYTKRGRDGRYGKFITNFLGSGTTIAVAHKMGRKFIGIEMGEQAYTHCKVRLDLTIDGKDASGITKAINWQGGAAIIFMNLRRR